MIGIFDSGSGGLTVLRAVAEELPQYIYVAKRLREYMDYNTDPEKMV